MGSVLRFIILIFFCGCFASCKDKEICSEETDENDPNRITFVQISDPHVMPPELLIKKGKAFEDYNYAQQKLLEESPIIFEEVLSRIRAIRPQLLFVTGDMSKDGEEVAHQWVVKKLKGLMDEIGVKVLVVPGNHDMNNMQAKQYDGDIARDVKTINEEEFRFLYNELGYSNAEEIREGELDYMSYPANSIAVICVNSTNKNNREKKILYAKGSLSEEQILWIEEMSKKAHKDGRYVIMLMHHNLVAYHDKALIRFDDIVNVSEQPLTNRVVIQRLANAGIDIVFSGHSHMQSITRGYGSKGNSIYSVVTSSLVNSPLAFRKGYITPQGKLSLTTQDLLDFKIDGVSLEELSDRYVRGITRYYENKFAEILCQAFPQKDSISLMKIQEKIFSIIIETLDEIAYTSIKIHVAGDEELSIPTPEENIKNLQKGLEDFAVRFAEEMKEESSLAVLSNKIERIISPLIMEIANSVYYNYLTTPFGREVLSDSELSIQLHK